MEKLKRILHVDDDKDILTVTRMTLELVGKFEVSQFSSGQEALKHAQAFAPQLFLLDVMMPRMGGEETWARLSALPGLEKVPTIFVTAKAESKYAESLVRQGALSVILKPFDPVSLCTTINEAWYRFQTRPAPKAEEIAM